MSTYSPATIKHLREQLAQLNSWRTNEECNLAGVETKVRTIKATIAELTERIADLEKLLAIVEPEPDPARAFIVGDLVNISESTHAHWGRRGKVTDIDAPTGLVAIEWDNVGNSLYVEPGKLMHHTEFVKQPQEYFDAAEAIERPVPTEWFEDGEDGEDGEQAAKDAEAVDDAMSTAERFEHDQADEFAQDAADAERWAEENAANQYDDEHYNTDDEDEDGED